jgi:hypothetical protein
MVLLAPSKHMVSTSISTAVADQSTKPCTALPQIIPDEPQQLQLAVMAATNTGNTAQQRGQHSSTAVQQPHSALPRPPQPRTYTLTHSLTLTHSHSLIHTHSLTLTHSHTHSLTLTHTHSLTRTHSLTHTHSHTHTHSLTHTHTHSHSLTGTHTHSLTQSHLLTLTHTHTHSQALTHTHRHSLTLTHIHTPACASSADGVGPPPGAPSGSCTSSTPLTRQLHASPCRQQDGPLLTCHLLTWTSSSCMRGCSVPVFLHTAP